MFPSFQSAVHGKRPSSPSIGGSRRTASMVPIRAWDHGIGLGTPVVPDVCKKQNGSFEASSNVFTYGKGFVAEQSKRSSSKGSCRTVIVLWRKKSLTNGILAGSPGWTQIWQSKASKTAFAPSVLFLGDKNRAWLKGKC